VMIMKAATRLSLIVCLNYKGGRGAWSIGLGSRRLSVFLNLDAPVMESSSR
jgi:hypothetical protein